MLAVGMHAVEWLKLSDSYCEQSNRTRRTQL